MLLGNFQIHLMLKTQIRKNNTDEAANLRWVLLIRIEKLEFSYEIKATVSLDGNAIKSKASGGDKIVARKHYKGEE